jgi:hypothetical protein
MEDKLEYHKIETLFERDLQTKKLIEGKFRNETIEFLKDIKWQFTEKIDGTNIRIIWDGHKVTFAGEVNEQIFEQKFGEVPVILYGEGYGAKIQNGGNYKSTQDFILFDVKIAGNWQSRETVEDIAKSFNIDVVPIVLEGTIQEGVDFVKTKPKSKIGIADSEGVVGRPFVELLDRCKHRVIVKIKVKDFE